MKTIGDLIAVLQKIDVNIEIENALQNQEIFDQLKVSFHGSSGETQKALRQAIKSILEDTSRNARLLQSVSKLDKISLPTKLEGKFQGSRRDPNSFWSPITNSLDPNALKTLSPTSSFMEIYGFTKTIQGKAFWTHIIWRFLALFFFDISQLYQVHRLFSADANRTGELLEALQIDQSHVGSIGSDLKKWLSAGETYAKFAQILGEGSLFLLPLELTNQYFEQRMPLQGDHFENLVRELKGKGIPEESGRIGAQELGRIVRDSILTPFKLGCATNSNGVPPKRPKRPNSRDRAQTKKRRKAKSTSKSARPRSSTIGLQDENSSRIREAPSCPNNTIISTASIATHTPSHIELSYGNSTTSPVNQITQERALSNEASHEAATLSSHLSYAPSIDQPEQHVSADCIPPSTPLPSSVSEGNSVALTSAPLMSQHPFSMQSWYAPDVNGFTDFQIHTNQPACSPLAPGPALQVREFLNWDPHSVEYACASLNWDPHSVEYTWDPHSVEYTWDPHSVEYTCDPPMISYTLGIEPDSFNDL